MTFSKQILAVADDDNIFQIIIKKMLQVGTTGWEIMTFNNGEEILQYLRNHLADQTNLPEVLLLDINMPRMDGWMFLDEYQKIKMKMPKEIKIYLTSSSIDLKDVNRAKANSHIIDYLIKPLSIEIIKKITAF